MHIQINIPVNDAALREILVARLGDLGFEGFEERPGELLAFASDDNMDEKGFEEYSMEQGFSYTREVLEDRNWNEEWERNFHPVVIGSFCAIRADFHEAIPGVEHELVITPKMSFGTGHHATTRLMIEAMQHQTVKGKRVLDFGTGTGVLAILAAKMGADEVIAIDYDDWSIENARENIVENKAEKITLLKGDRIGSLAVSGSFDLVLANINKNVIMRQLPDIKQYLREQGVLLLSGLLEGDFEEIRQEAARNQILISERTAIGSWICLITKGQVK
jgi:ribosomal protein L11 methyltransferase